MRKTVRHLQLRNFTYNSVASTTTSFFCTTWSLLRTTLDPASCWLSQAYRDRECTSDRKPARTSDTNLACTSDCSPEFTRRCWACRQTHGRRREAAGTIGHMAADGAPASCPTCGKPHVHFLQARLWLPRLHNPQSLSPPTSRPTALQAAPVPSAYQPQANQGDSSTSCNNLVAEAGESRLQVPCASALGVIVSGCPEVREFPLLFDDNTRVGWCDTRRLKCPGDTLSKLIHPSDVSSRTKWQCRHSGPWAKLKVHLWITSMDRIRMFLETLLISHFRAHKTRRNSSVGDMWIWKSNL